MSTMASVAASKKQSRGGSHPLREHIAHRCDPEALVVNEKGVIVAGGRLHRMSC